MIAPSSNPHLFGHEAAEGQFLDALAKNKLPHAWLISGVRGIGKATLAWRIARFLMAGAPMPEAEGPGLFGPAEPAAPTLGLPEGHPIFSRIENQSLLDLLTVTGEDEDGEREITVDEIRKLQQFFTMSAAESKWRVVLIDGADAMNRNAQNALLKILEEPPANALLLLVCHNTGAMLPTIRSRCRALKLAPLSETNMRKAMDTLLPSHEQNEAAIALSGGAPGLALTLADADSQKLINTLDDALGVFEGKRVAVGDIAEKLTRRGEERHWHPTVFLLRHLVAERMHRAPSEKWMELWEKSGNLIGQTEGLNMDKRAALMEFFTP